MIIIKFRYLQIEDFVNKYKDKVTYIDTSIMENQTKKEWLIQNIELIKDLMPKYEIIFVDLHTELISAFDLLKFRYGVIYPNVEENTLEKEQVANYKACKILAQKTEALVIQKNQTIEETLQDRFEFIKEELEKEKNEEEKKQTEENRKKIEELKQKQIEDRNKEENKKKDKEEVKEIAKVKEPVRILSLQDVMKDDISISEADMRAVKLMTNKFKVAMLLQAKERFKMVIKFCDVLNKLYGELTERLDSNLENTTTRDLMYTADYLAKALNDSNQFIMSIINNEKMQEFFTINEEAVSEVSVNPVDINKRERIRKAAEIIIDNVDYFSKDQYQNIINPNETIINVEKEEQTENLENKNENTDENKNNESGEESK